MTAETVVDEATAAELATLRAAPTVDRDRAARAVADLLASLGYPVEGEHRARTPERVASCAACWRNSAAAPTPAWNSPQATAA